MTMSAAIVSIAGASGAAANGAVTYGISRGFTGFGAQGVVMNVFMLITESLGPK